MHLKYSIIMVIGLAVFFGSNSCSIVGNEANPLKVENMRINHFRQTGIGEGLYLVYLVQENEEIGGEKWSFFYDEIEGFDYELGYIYDLKVRKVDIENPPMDGSSVKYILVNVRSKEKVAEDESFEIKLKWGGSNFVTGSNNNFYLLDEYKITCADLCQELAEMLQNKEEVSGVFVHGDNQTLKLNSVQ